MKCVPIWDAFHAYIDILLYNNIFHIVIRQLFHLFRYMRVYIHSCRNIGMAQNILDQLYVHSGFAQSGGKGMSQIMAAEVRQ